MARLKMEVNIHLNKQRSWRTTILRQPSSRACNVGCRTFFFSLSDGYTYLLMLSYSSLCNYRAMFQSPFVYDETIVVQDRNVVLRVYLKRGGKSFQYRVFSLRWRHLVTAEGNAHSLWAYLEKFGGFVFAIEQINFFQLQFYS